MIVKYLTQESRLHDDESFWRGPVISGRYFSENFNKVFFLFHQNNASQFLPINTISSVSQNKRNRQRITQPRHHTYKRNIDTRSCNHFYRGKATYVTYSECLSAVVVTHQANRMLRIIFASVVCPAIQNLSTLFHKRHDFRKESE